jgi:hypothetical protein
MLSYVAIWDVHILDNEIPSLDELVCHPEMHTNMEIFTTVSTCISM